jgi:hypothetical protein
MLIYVYLVILLYVHRMKNKCREVVWMNSIQALTTAYYLWGLKSNWMPCNFTFSMELEVFFTIIQQTYSLTCFMNRKSSCGYATHFF